MLVMSALTSSSKPLRVEQANDIRVIFIPVMLYPSATTTLLALTAYFHLVSSQLIVPQVQPQQGFREENLEQIPIELDFGWHNPEMEGLQPNGPPLLSDILGIDRSLSIFAGLGRSIEIIASRLADESTNSTLLVPRNSALQILPQKPWEDKDEKEGIRRDGKEDLVWDQEVEDQARKNVEDFVAGHVITRYPVEEGKKVDTLRGTQVEYRVTGGDKYVYPGEIKVLGEREAANGAIWVLDGVIE